MEIAFHDWDEFKLASLYTFNINMHLRQTVARFKTALYDHGRNNWLGYNTSYDYNEQIYSKISSTELKKNTKTFPARQKIHYWSRGWALHQ